MRRISMEINLYFYTVDKKKEGSYRLQRALMISAYVLYCVVFFLAVYITRIFPLGALIPMTLYIIYLFTWRYVSIEYKYTVESGLFSLYRVYGGKKQQKMCELRIKDAKRIIPTDDYKHEIRDFAPVNIYDGRSSADAPDGYAILFIEDAKPAAVYIDAPDSSVKVFHYYNPDNTVKAIKKTP